ncbi:MAG: hypothetical protein ACI4M8_02365 [Christensenellales bacterium]
MAKQKTVYEPEVSVKEKTLEEMTDGEFLSGIEEWSTPLYEDYISAPRISETSASGYLSATKIGILAKNFKKPVKETVVEDKGSQTAACGSGKYVKKRGLLVAIITVLTLAVLVMIALGSLNINGISDYLLMYESKDGNVGIIDPVVSMVTYLIGQDADVNFAAYFESAGRGYGLIAPYGVACATILYVLCVAAMFIKSMFALFEKRTVCGYYKKRKFGFLSIVAFLCAVVCVIGGLYVSGGDITGIADFVLRGERSFVVGYGTYAMLAVPVVTLVMSAFGYGKKKK